MASNANASMVDRQATRIGAVRLNSALLATKSTGIHARWTLGLWGAEESGPSIFGRVSERTVLHVLQPEDGGVAQHVLGLACGLERHGWTVEAAVSPSSTILPELAAAGVRVHTLPLARRPASAVLRVTRALRALDRERSYSLVHAHSSKAGALVRISLPRRRRLVYTPHCFAFAARFGAPRRLAYQVIEQALVPRSGAIVAVCEWERALALRRLRGVSRRLHVITNGVGPCGSPGSPNVPARELLEFKGRSPLAGLVTVLRPQKDPLLAVRAAALLDDAGAANGRLAIVGNGELRSDIEAEIEKLGVSDRVRWFPFEGGVKRYLAALDVFVLPSSWEAFPLSVLEAMSCGLPVVATRVGGVPEAVEDGVTGRLVEPGNAKALADAMGELLASQQLRGEMGTRGRAECERRFRAEAVVDATAHLYEELLAAG
jgi:glycosyltransferase involved in cell wall biosynthesis